MGRLVSTIRVPDERPTVPEAQGPSQRDLAISRTEVYNREEDPDRFEGIIGGKPASLCTDLSDSVNCEAGASVSSRMITPYNNGGVILSIPRTFRFEFCLV